MDEEMETPSCQENEEFSENDIAAEIIVKFQNSSQDEHHNICAIVGAMSQTLKEQGLALKPVAYFAAAVSFFVRLVGVDPSAAAGDPNISAILSLLSIILPSVPSVVLRSEGGIFLESLARIIGCGSLRAGGVKAALKCISHMLVVDDKIDWSSASPLYGIILNHVTDHNYKSIIHLFATVSDRATVKNLFKKNLIELLKVTKQVIKVKESKESSSMPVDNIPTEAFLTRARALLASKENGSSQWTRDLKVRKTNKKTRNKAYDLLVEIGHSCGDEERGGNRENLHQFFNM